MKQKNIFITIILIFVLSLFSTTSYAETTTSETITLTNNLDLASKAVILIDSKTGTELYSKNANKKMYPASTTKIMTAILGIENGNLDDIVTASKSAISSIPSGYSSAYLVQGEKISLKDLLIVLLVHSANEAANVIAEHVSGSVDEFVVLMNEKAKELGCEDTNFVNTNGIHDSEHYTTASDLAIIANYCMKNETFREIVSMPSCTISKTNKSGIRKYSNTNTMIIENTDYYRDDCIGIKTGHTSQAGYCLVSAIQKDDMELISVVLGGANEEDRFKDSDSLLTYGYDAYDAFIKIQKSREEEERRIAEEQARALAEKKAQEEALARRKTILKTTLTIILITLFCIIIIRIIYVAKKRRIKKNSQGKHR